MLASGLPFALTLGALTFMLTAIWGGPFVEVLRRLRVGKNIRPEEPESNQEKQGTPTMGGILILVPVVVITIGLNLVSLIRQVTGASVLLPLFVMVGHGLVGALDDIEGITGSRAKGEGISPRVKFIAQITIEFIAAIFMAGIIGKGFSFANQIYLPLIGVAVPISPILYVPLAMFVINASTNAVNLTDGLDGLAGLTTASAFIAYGILAYLQTQIYLAQFCFILVGACFAFLWYNAKPAQLFMGDTGALALGATLGTIALMTGQWLLLPLFAFIPVIETVSVIIQVSYFKATGGKRIFRMSPIHYHFLKGGWSETQVVQRFWLVSILGAGVGVALALIGRT
ncbi:MAG: phospho-N-acetylmuramoyl-pentapeptide-transferase [Aggregatilineales bacterium]